MGLSSPDVERALERDDLERPSAAVTGPEAPPGLGDGRSLRRRLRGDLDTIVLKALHPDPERRYESVADLTGDIRRHLTGHPVRAPPDAPAYRKGTAALCGGRGRAARCPRQDGARRGRREYRNCAARGSGTAHRVLRGVGQACHRPTVSRHPGLTGGARRRHRNHEPPCWRLSRGLVDSPRSRSWPGRAAHAARPRYSTSRGYWWQWFSPALSKYTVPASSRIALVWR